MRSDRLKHVEITVIVGFNYHDHSLNIRSYMQFLGAAVNIDQKKIIKKKILDKIIFVETFLVGYDEVLDLECDHLTYHIYVFTRTAGYKNIFRSGFIIYLKIRITLDLLRVGRRLCKFSCLS